MATTSSLAGLQSEEQSHVLDIVQQLRQVGLDSVLSLPQLVVCGDQSAGKSSVLEALTEIPFPRNDNLCTRKFNSFWNIYHINAHNELQVSPQKSTCVEEPLIP